jgi:signal transduction histidine kinase
MGFTDLARMSAKGNEKLLGYLDRISSASFRARDLVRQILTFSRKDEVEKQLINIRPLILETIEFVRASLPADIEINHSLTQEKSLVLGDSTQLHQIFMNLFTNATHAMGGKGGTLEVSMAKTVKHEDEAIREILPGNYLEIIVSDTGSGIPRAVVDRIFEPFFTTKVRGKGTGMGLSTVYGILKDMGGSIEVSTQEDMGTTFTLLIPEQIIKSE